MRALITFSVFVCFFAVFALGQNAGPTVKTPVRFDVSPDLYTMASQAPPIAPSTPQEVVQKHPPIFPARSTQRATVTAAPTTSVLQKTTLGSPRFAAIPGVNFEGLGTGFPGYFVGLAPPDTTLAVGPNHVVQWVNVHFAIFNKAGVPLLAPPGFVAGNTLWAGFGGLCQTQNRGDVLVAYDAAADRWVFSQFAFTGNGTVPPFLQCVAVTTGPNPAGPYFRYAYSYTEGFNDYGKIGVWPDAYYMSYNMFSAVAYLGTKPCAMDRAAMLAGNPAAAQICFPTAFWAGGFPMLPSYVEGATTPPPAGAPNYFITFPFVPSELRLLKFHVDFVTPANSTFSDGLGGGLGSFVALPVGPTLAPCNDFAGACIPQPAGGEVLDTLGDRLMYRLAYRRRGTGTGSNESLMVNHSVDPDGAGPVQSQVRWYEVRNPGGNPPTVFQNATYMPDATNRWMASIGMDKMGNMAVGYSVSSSTVFPGIRITGRLRSEIRNTMQSEATIINGTGSQFSTFNRWGDYSTINVDPSDDCTFWYTTEYIGANGSFNWRTRIASFRFPGCQ